MAAAAATRRRQPAAAGSAIHGGPPAWQQLDFEMQLFAARYAVPTPIRAARPDTADFLWATWAVGASDHEDVMAGVDYVLLITRLT
jgi:hypothetical protein